MRSRPTISVMPLCIGLICLMSACLELSDRELSLLCNPGNQQLSPCPCGTGSQLRTCQEDRRWGPYSGECSCQYAEACDHSEQCAFGLSCSQGKCLTACQDDGPCRIEGGRCVDGACLSQQLPCIEAGLNCPQHAGCLTIENAPSCSCDPYFSGSECQHCVVYVDATGEQPAPDGRSWPTAFPTIELGIEAAYAAVSGTLATCQVWVAGGVYHVYDDSPGNTLRLRPRIHLYGGFSGNETTLSERALHNTSVISGHAPFSTQQRVYHVVTGASHTVLDGFTIRDGHADGAQGDTMNGGAMLNIATESMTVRNCTFTGNTAAVAGGAIYNRNANVLFDACTFKHNQAHHGGALYNFDTAVSITASTFSLNSAVNGGAIYNNNAVIALESSYFIENSAENGGAIYNILSSPTIVSCDFEENVADAQGGAIYSFGSESVIDDTCTFTGNHAAQGDSIHEMSASKSRVTSFAL